MAASEFSGFQVGSPVNPPFIRTDFLDSYPYLVYTCEIYVIFVCVKDTERCQKSCQKPWKSRGAELDEDFTGDAWENLAPGFPVSFSHCGGNW